jgi:hypothetical protein
MPHDLPIPFKIEFRNFNLCPHCEHMEKTLSSNA